MEMVTEFVQRASRRGSLAMLVLCGYVVLLSLALHVDLRGTPFHASRFPPYLRFADKVFHLVTYGGLTVLVLYVARIRAGSPLAGRKRNMAARQALLALIVILWGTLEEITQPYFGRNFDVQDCLANVVGVVMGVAAYNAWSFRANSISLLRAGNSRSASA